MITKPQFDILHQAYRDAFDASWELNLTLERLVFGENCFIDVHSNQDLTAKITNIESLFECARKSGISEEWISNSILALEYRQAKRKLKQLNERKN